VRRPGSGGAVNRAGGGSKIAAPPRPGTLANVSVGEGAGVTGLDCEGVQAELTQTLALLASSQAINRLLESSLIF
jgi:hypothetical protein